MTDRYIVVNYYGINTKDEDKLYVLHDNVRGRDVEWFQSSAKAANICKKLNEKEPA